MGYQTFRGPGCTGWRTSDPPCCLSRNSKGTGKDRLFSGRDSSTIVLLACRKLNGIGPSVFLTGERKRHLLWAPCHSE